MQGGFGIRVCGRKRGSRVASFGKVGGGGGPTAGSNDKISVVRSRTEAMDTGFGKPPEEPVRANTLECV